jgi:iron complex transport system permease protein
MFFRRPWNFTAALPDSHGCFMENSRGREVKAIVLSGGAMLVSFAIAVMIGSSHVDLTRALRGLSPDREILLELRVPRALLALWTGGALALSGVVFQAILRNPLATPYTLGVSGGASLGAVIAIFAGWSTFAGLPAVNLAACIGAAAVLALIVSVASRSGRMSSVGLLLAGITLNSMCGAAILFLSNLAGVLKSFAVTRWLMGGIDAPGYGALLWLTVILAPVCLVIFRYGREWNLLAIGENWAATRGVATGRLLLIGCVAGSVLTGLVTALTGPIGFVGLIVPHALRMRLGADHRILAPASFLTGAAFLALCDTFSRTMLAPIEIPVGVVTALAGGPIFVRMLRGRGGMAL